MNLYHVVGVTPGYIGDARTQLRVEEHVHHIFHVTNPLDKVIVTRSDDETVPVEHRGVEGVPN